MQFVVSRCFAVAVFFVVFGCSSVALAQKWVFDGVILSARGPAKSHASLRAGVPNKPKNFASQNLSSTSLLLAEKFGATKLFNSKGEETPKPYSGRSKQCKLAKFRKIRASIQGHTRCEANYAQFISATPNDPKYDPTYANALMSLEPAWNYTTGSSDLVVVVIDTGVLYSHPDLMANIWTNPGEIAGNGIDDDGNGVIDDIHGVNATTWGGLSTLGNAGDPLDDNGHGTHCAGILGGKGNNAQGVAGVNWNVKIAAAKFLSSSGSGSTGDAVKAIEYATQLRKKGHKVVVTSNSWGGGGYSQALYDAINAGSAQGIMFVAAAGNSAVNTDTTPFYPAAYTLDSVISVASTDRTGNLSYFSNYGASTVDIAAPGSSIESTYLNNGYATLSGTSMAAPHVSGLIALAQSMCGSGSLLSVAQARNVLLSSGAPYSGLSGKIATGAIANAAGAVSAAFSACGASTPSPSPTATSTPTRSPTATIAPTKTATPVPSYTTTIAPTPSQTPTQAPTWVPTLAPTLVPSLAPTLIPTFTYTATATQTPRPTPTATQTPRPTSTATPVPPTATPKPIVSSLTVSPSTKVTDGAVLTMSLAGIGTESSAVIQVFGHDGRWPYACPAFSVSLTGGATTVTAKLPTTPHRMQTLQIFAISRGRPIQQQISMAAPFPKPDVRLGVKNMSEVCAALQSGFSQKASQRKVSAKRISLRSSKP